MSPRPASPDDPRPLVGWLLFLGVVAAAVAPVAVAAAQGRVPGHPASDLADHVQGAWWWGGEILAGRVPRQVGGVLFPDGGVLWYPDPLGASLALLFRWLGPYGSFSASLAVVTALNAATAWWLGRRVTGTTTGALITAAVAGPSAYALGLLHSGLTEYLGVWTVMLFLGAHLGWLEEGRRPWAPPLAMALAAVQCFYYGAFCAVVGLCLALAPSWRQTGRRAVRAAVAVGAGALLVAPLLGYARATLSHPESAFPLEAAPSWSQPRAPEVDLLGFLAPWDHYWPDTPALGNPGILQVHHLGWVALALAVLALVRSPRARSFGWGAAAWAVLGLGPALVVAGRALVPLPGWLLYLDASPFTSVHHPYRMVAVTLPLLGLLAGLGAARLGPGARWLAIAVLLEAHLLSPAPWPWVSTDPHPPAEVPWAELPAGAVLDLPPDHRGPDRRYVLWSLGHGRPVPYGVNAWLSPSLREDPATRSLLEPLATFERRTNRDVPPREPPWLPPVDHGGLEGLGFGAVVVHRQWLAPAEVQALESALTEALGPPGGEGEDRAWWGVGAGNTPGVEDVPPVHR